MADWKDLYECPTCGDIFETKAEAFRCCGTGEAPIHRYRRLTSPTPNVEQQRATGEQESGAGEDSR